MRFVRGKRPWFDSPRESLPRAFGPPWDFSSEVDGINPKMQKMRESGKTLEQVATWLNDRGHETAAGNSWSANSVYRKLNPRRKERLPMLKMDRPSHSGSSGPAFSHPRLRYCHFPRVQKGYVDVDTGR